MEHDSPSNIIVTMPISGTARIDFNGIADPAWLLLHSDPDLVGPQYIRGLVGVGVHWWIGGDIVGQWLEVQQEIRRAVKPVDPVAETWPGDHYASTIGDRLGIGKTEH